MYFIGTVSFNGRQNHPVLFHLMMYLSRPLFLKCLHYTIKSKGWPFYNIYPIPHCWVRLRPSPPHNVSTVSSPSPSASSLFCLARKDIHCIQNQSLPVSINSGCRQSPMTKVNLYAGVSIMALRITGGEEERGWGRKSVWKVSDPLLSPLPFSNIYMGMYLNQYIWRARKPHINIGLD